MRTIAAFTLFLLIPLAACHSVAQSVASTSETTAAAGQELPASTLYEFGDNDRQSPFARRAFRPTLDEHAICEGISYGPFRDGQSPAGPYPSREEVREDLHILAKHWKMLRLYGSDPFAETILDVIREDNLPIRVMQGAWVITELNEDGTPIESARAVNRKQVTDAIRLANKYNDIVIAINVGNETQIFWSFHKVRPEVLIDYIRAARKHTDVPVTTAEYWTDPATKRIAAECDFLVTHIYAMWNKQQLADALPWTIGQYNIVRSLHPGYPIVIGEIGWATKKLTTGEQRDLILGTAGEAEQAAFYNAFIKWTRQERLSSFWFSAFDENWKGGPEPDHAEKHWGLYRADRSPKPAAPR